MNRNNIFIVAIIIIVAIGLHRMYPALSNIETEGFFNANVNVPSGYPVLEEDRKALNPQMWKKMLVRNEDGTVRLETVPINVPFEEVRRIYGPMVRKYLYQDKFEHPCPCYPTKRRIDSVGSNYFIPKMCDICSQGTLHDECKKEVEWEESPSDPERSPSRSLGTRVKLEIASGVHPLKDIYFGPNPYSTERRG